jgi:hypothetical protein
MKNIIIALSILSLLCSELTDTQSIKNKLDSIQGIWKSNESEKSEESFTIIKGMNALSITYTDDSEELDFPLSESIQGFQNESYEDIDSIHVNTLKADGAYFTSAFRENVKKSGWVEKPYFTIPSYFEVDDNTMSIGGGQLAEFSKITSLPPFTLKQLYKRGKLDKRNYLKDYLGLIFKEVVSPKCTIYQSPGIATKMYIIKGDLVSILEQQGNWVKIEYQGKKKVQGWLKKSDIR